MKNDPYDLRKPDFELRTPDPTKITDLLGRPIFEDSSCKTFEEILQKAIDQKVQLDGADFRHWKLSNMTISRLNLSNTYWDHSELENVKFESVVFTDGSFRDTKYKDVTFDNAGFNGAKVNNSKWEKCSINYCFMDKNTFKGTEFILSDFKANFRDYFYFDRSTLNKCRFIGTDKLERTYFSNSQLNECEFKSTNKEQGLTLNYFVFQNTVADRCVFDNVEFKSCYLAGLTCNQSKMQKITLSNCIADGLNIDKESQVSIRESRNTDVDKIQSVNMGVVSHVKQALSRGLGNVQKKFDIGLEIT